MTPQEQQLVADLFDRLASLEGQRRDPDAERVIHEGLGRAPNGVYALVQTVLVQDEALKRANARIEELERAGQEPAQAPAGGGGFLDSMRSVLTGRDQRGSVPSVPPGGQGSSGVWGGGPRPQAAPAVPPPAGGQPGGQFGGSPGGPMGGMGGGMMGGGGGGGSSFLGTAAATVAGVVGGAMLLNGIRSMMGGGGHQAFGDYGGMSPGSSPWDSGGGRGSGDLARDAGLGDIGGGHPSAAYDDSRRAGASDNSSDQPQDDAQDDGQFDDAQDDGQADDDYAGGFDSGDDSDTA
jgi:uncharacterized protein